MTTQLLGWAATILGLYSTWLCGHHHRTGWLYGIACCALWTTVNIQLHLTAGIASAAIAGVIAARNWRAWRTNNHKP